MKKSVTILLLLLAFTLCANAQNAGQYVRRQPSQQNTQKSTQKSTQKTTQKSTQKTTQKSTPQNTPKTAQKSTQKSTPQTSSKGGPNLCPDSNHPHMIDLGLPSGTKWACCNVGANTPEAYGGYYSWGETNEKSTYTLANYIHCDGSWETFHNIGSNISGTQYDVAYVKWGGSWVMPSKAQLDELRDNCTYQWTTYNGVNGGKFTSKKNSASIFLPAAGDRLEDGLYDVGSNCVFWSSVQNPSHSYSAYHLDLHSGFVDSGGGSYRIGGLSVRPVSK